MRPGNGRASLLAFNVFFVFSLVAFFAFFACACGKKDTPSRAAGSASAPSASASATSNVSLKTLIWQAPVGKTCTGEDSYVACKKKGCAEQYRACYGSDDDHVGGPCKAFAECAGGCAGDLACTSGCVAFRDENAACTACYEAIIDCSMNTDCAQPACR